MSPVCAITGGILAQEIIKAVSKKDEPHNNFFFYNGVDSSAIIEKIGEVPTIIEKIVEVPAAEIIDEVC